MAKRKPVQEVTSNRPKQCSWNDHGSRCERDGYISDTTFGLGPWYCRDHYADLKGWPRITGEKPLSMEVEEMTRELKEPYRSRAIERQRVSRTAESMVEVDKRVNKLVPRLPGESEHDWSMRCRLWTLDQVSKLSKRFQQEPGANG